MSREPGTSPTTEEFANKKFPDGKICICTSQTKGTNFFLEMWLLQQNKVQCLN